MSEKASSSAKTKKTRQSSKMTTPCPRKEKPQRLEWWKETRRSHICKLRLRKEKERCLSLDRSRRSSKKYGVMVTAIFLTTGVTIGAVVGALTNTLKATGKVMGNGLKDIGLKVGSILRYLIGLIVSFLFKAAGQVIGMPGI